MSSEAVARRLIERHRVEPQVAGSVVRIVALTHNLEPDFFDEDLLPNVLGLSRIDDKSYAAGIALQRKLQGITCRVLMAQGAYRGRPGLRTEIRPVTLPFGRLHAKCLVVEYERAVLVSIGSANLTTQGFRKNREVAGVMLTRHDEPGEAATILEALSGAIRSLEPVRAPWIAPMVDDLVATRRKVQGWHPAPPASRHSIVWSDTRHRLLDTMVAVASEVSPVRRIDIVSPFWCEDGHESPLRALLTRLRTSGLLSDRVEVHLHFDAHALEDGGYRPVYPSKFKVIYDDIVGVQVFAHAVKPDVDPGDVDFKVELNATRPLHAKIMLLEGDRGALAYAGSANFTRHGLGVRGAANIEAGWLLRGTTRELRALIPRSAVEPEPILSGNVAPEAPASDEDETLYFPDFLLEVLLKQETEHTDVLQLGIVWSEAAPSRFDVQTVISDDNGVARGGPKLLTLGGSAGETAVSLDAEIARHLFQTREIWIHNHDIERGGPYPLNLTAEARLVLPLAPGAARPGEEALLAYYQGKLSLEELYPDPEGPPAPTRQTLDPVERSSVDTSRIQSYRIRAFVEALPGMLEELTKTSGPPPLLELTFLGDTSPVGLARCIQKEVQSGLKSPTAAAFQLVEILRVIQLAAQHIGERDPVVLAEVSARAERCVTQLLQTVRAGSQGLLGETSAFAAFQARILGGVR